MGNQMSVVSVINYKGGVGKTTATANLGAGLAKRGRNVLLVDLDPQASLTFSFIRPETWHDKYASSKTIKTWYDSFDSDSPLDLSSLAIVPMRVQERLKSTRSSGSLRLIPSHLVLINVDLELASELGGSSVRQTK